VFRISILLCAAAMSLHGQAPRPLTRSEPARAAAPAGFDSRNAIYPSLGDPDAPVLIVEFSEFGCPYCRRHADSVLPQLLDKYVNTGTVRYLFVQVPPAEEAGAELGALALLCAARLDALLPVYQQLFHTSTLDRQTVLAAATTAGVQGDAFTQCMDGSNVRSELQQHIEFAKQSRVVGTPTFLIGRSKNGRLIDAATTFGIQPVSFFESRVNRLLGAR
jgi:protein-disulfide isomerase